MKEMAPEEDFDYQFVKTFLLTYPSYMHPKMVLKKLMQLFYVPRAAGMTQEAFNKVNFYLRYFILLTCGSETNGGATAGGECAAEMDSNERLGQ